MKDVECPYCGEEQYINHDDGYGYDESRTHQQECRCGKTFVYETYVSFSYEVNIAPCLNEESDHKWKKTMTVPKRYTKMKCEWCDEERELTPEEKVEMGIDNDE